MNINQKSYIPIELSYPYLRKDDKFLCYRSDFMFLDLEDNQMDFLALFTSLQLPISPKFEEPYLFRYKVNVKNINELTMFSFEQHQRLCLYNFYILNDMFLDYHQEIDLQRFYNINSYQKETFLFIHLNNIGEIDWDSIENYLKFKTTKNINVLNSVISENIEQLIENKIVIGSRNLNVTLFIHQIIQNPQSTSALEFFQRLQNDNAFESFDEAIQYYGLHKDQIQDWTVNDLLLYKQLPYMEDNRHRENIDGYRVFINQHQDSPVAFLSYLKHFKQIHPNQDQLTKDYCMNCKQKQTQCKVVRDEALKMPQLYPLNQLYIYPFASKSINFINRILTRFIDRLIEWIRTENLKKIYNISADPYWLKQALCTSSVSSLNNYQVLEVLGDSILKYITSTMKINYLFQDSKQLTISTWPKFLFQLQFLNMYQNKIIYSNENRQLLKHIIKSIWRTICPKIIKQKQIALKYDKIFFKIKIAESQLADIYEAFIGAIYQSDFNHKDIIKFLIDTNFALPICENDYIPLLLNTDFKTQIINFEYTSLLNQYPLDLFKSKYNLSFCLKEYNIIQFQNEILRYQFKDKNLLLEALQFPNKFNSNNYEKLEFLGDAIIETFLISNVFQILHRKRLQNEIKYRTGEVDRDDLICPGMFTSIKISLLDNGFMATMSLLLGYHNQITDLPEAEKAKLPFILQELHNLRADLNSMRKLDQKLPKCYGDVFESVAAAILLDGGWESFLQVYGRFYSPFIQFITDNIEDIYKSDRLKII